MEQEMSESEFYLFVERGRDLYSRILDRVYPDPDEEYVLSESDIEKIMKHYSVTPEEFGHISTSDMDISLEESIAFLVTLYEADEEFDEGAE